MNNNLKVAEAPDTIEYSYKDAKTRSRRAAYSFHITHEGNEAAILAGNASPAKTFDSYTWPESRAPSRDVTPVPPPRLRKIRMRKVVPASSRVLRSKSVAVASVALAS